MKMKKPIFSVIAAGITIMSVLAATPIMAADTTTDTQPNENFFVGWFHKLFNKVVIAFKHENKQQYSLGDLNRPSGTPPATTPGEKQKLTDEERLTKLVTQGKITADQKAAIIAELTTLQTTYGQDALKGLTEQQRMKKLEEMRAALKAWAKAQGIEIGYVMPEIPGNGQGQGGPNDERGGQRPPEGQRMNRPLETPKPTPTPES